MGCGPENVTLPDTKWVVWCFSDGKPGHENQMRGLLQALSLQHQIAIRTFYVNELKNRWLNALFGRFPAGANLPKPDLLLAAGHATHIPMLAAQRAYGGKAVTLMKPSLPLRWFDLCIVPEHDHVSADNVITTRGVLNAVRPAEEKDPHKGMLLIGGPSRHHGWSDVDMLEQIKAIVTTQWDVHWILTNSRRTPASFMDALWSYIGSHDLSVHLAVHPWQEAEPAWLPEQLADSTNVWVSEDSVSMIYEAMSSAAAVGVLQVPRKKDGRVITGLETLLNQGVLVRFADWKQGKPLLRPMQVQNEADRCAVEVEQRLGLA